VSASKITVRDLGFSYKGKEQLQVLDNVGFEVYDGEFVCIIGPSGCGKTTILNMVAGVTRPDKGEIWIDDKNVDGLAQNIGYVSQKDTVFPWFTVEKNVALGLRFKREDNQIVTERVKAMLEMGGLQSFGKAYPHQLSGGMRRRVAVLMSLAVQPEVLLLDEPLFGLDEYTKISLQAELLRLWSSIKGTWVMVTHDIGEAIALSDRVILMSSRPSHVKATFEIRIARPRDVLSIRKREDYLRLYGEIWAALSGEFKED
jgi:sulfonate transport system ATP-binding protein